MARQIRIHLMFEGSAEEAMNFYVGLIPGSRVLESKRYKSGEHKGKLELGLFSLGGREFICFNSPLKHGFGFTPSMSIFVDCESDAELDRLFAALAEGGEVRMPLDNYGFSSRFGWVSDRFGVSWQLNLP